MTKVGQKLKEVLMQNFKPGTVLTNMDLFAIARRITPSTRWQSEAIKELVRTGYLKSIGGFKFEWLGEKKEEHPDEEILPDFPSPNSEEKGINPNTIRTNSENQHSDQILSRICPKEIRIKTLVEKLQLLITKTRAKIFYCLTLKECYYWEFIDRFRIWQQSLDLALLILEDAGIIERTSGSVFRNGRGRKPEKFYKISESFRSSPYYEPALQLAQEVLGEEEIRRIQRIINPGVVHQRSEPPSDEEINKAIEAVARIMFKGGDFREVARIQAAKLGIDEDTLVEQAKKRYDEIVKSIPGRPGKYYIQRGIKLPI